MINRGKVQRALEAENNPDVDINWKQVSFTPPYTTKRTIYLEIISAVGFGDGDPLYVKYQAQLPENWKLFGIKQIYLDFFKINYYFIIILYRN